MQSLIYKTIFPLKNVKDISCCLEQERKICDVQKCQPQLDLQKKQNKKNKVKKKKKENSYIVLAYLLHSWNFREIHL